MRNSTPILTEPEIVAEEAAMPRAGLTASQMNDLDAWNARERSARNKRREDRQARYDREQR